MRIIYEEKSRRDRQGIIWMVFFMALLLGAVIYTTLKCMDHGRLVLDEYFIEITAFII